MLSQDASMMIKLVPEPQPVPYVCPDDGAAWRIRSAKGISAGSVLEIIAARVRLCHGLRLAFGMRFGAQHQPGCRSRGHRFSAPDC